MKNPMKSLIPRTLIVCSLAAAMVTASVAADSGANATKSKGSASQWKAAKLGEIPQSVFNAGGRNPFFPNSTMGAPVAPVAKNSSASPVEPGAFVLNGITSPPRRTAMINGRTFEPGEEGEIKLPTGSKVLVKVAEIRDDSAIIIVSGVRRELRLKFAL